MIPLLSASQAAILSAHMSATVYDRIMWVHRSDRVLFRQYNAQGISKHAPFMWKVLTRNPKFRHGGRREKRLAVFHVTHAAILSIIADAIK